LSVEPSSERLLRTKAEEKSEQCIRRKGRLC
jgi:ribosomal protein L36